MNCPCRWLVENTARIVAIHIARTTTPRCVKDSTYRYVRPSSPDHGGISWHEMEMTR